mmetsp:Transcript_45507/g.116446  ORF Transcript_45507/g.116446 Transcript_45507/m.116446 type:complete len:223 (-) Transcript_45507:67-735(-)
MTTRSQWQHPCLSDVVPDNSLCGAQQEADDHLGNRVEVTLDTHPGQKHGEHHDAGGNKPADACVAPAADNGYGYIDSQIRQTVCMRRRHPRIRFLWRVVRTVVINKFLQHLTTDDRKYGAQQAPRDVHVMPPNQCAKCSSADQPLCQTINHAPHMGVAFLVCCQLFTTVESCATANARATVSHWPAQNRAALAARTKGLRPWQYSHSPRFDAPRQMMFRAFH